jgi:MFS family permease
MNLPLILGIVIPSILAAWLTSQFGYYLPFIYLSVVLSSIGAGLLSTLTVGSGSPAWIGYQALFGIGAGSSISLCVVVAQTALPPADTPAGTAMVTFTQSLAGTLMNFVAQNVFQNRLMQGLAQAVPELDAANLVEAGPTMIRALVPEHALPAVLKVYNTAITQTFYVAVACAALAIFGVPPLQWLSVKGRKIHPGAA